MSKFGTKEEIIETISAHFESMKSSKIKLEDLENLVEQTRELYERALVLRFKAYEEKVFGEAKELVADESFEAEELVIESEEMEAELESEMIEVENDEEPIFDLSLFDEAKEASTEKVEEEEILEDESENEIGEEASEFEASEEKFEEFSAKEESVEEESAPVQNTTNTERKTSIFKEILESEEDNSLASTLNQGKLERLQGAFGFNEKFQCIQELFNSSSEDFNQALDILDKLANFDEAETQLEYYVRLNNWDLESDVVADFVRKVERRFA